MLALTICYAALLGIVALRADAGGLKWMLDPVHQTPFGDKAVHFAIAGVLALLLNISLRPASLRLVRSTSAIDSIVIGSTITIVLATIEEISNIWVPARDWSLGDLAANYLGILCIGTIPVLLHHRRARLRHLRDEVVREALLREAVVGPGLGSP